MTDIGWQAYDFVVGGHLVAFRTSENEINRDLNGTFILGDIVMMFYDLATNTVINPRRPP